MLGVIYKTRKHHWERSYVNETISNRCIFIVHQETYNILIRSHFLSWKIKYVKIYDFLIQMFRKSFLAL